MYTYITGVIEPFKNGRPIRSPSILKLVGCSLPADQLFEAAMALVWALQPSKFTMEVWTIPKRSFHSGRYCSAVLEWDNIAITLQHYNEKYKVCKYEQDHCELLRLLCLHLVSGVGSTLILNRWPIQSFKRLNNTFN